MGKVVIPVRKCDLKAEPVVWTAGVQLQVPPPAAEDPAKRDLDKAAVRFFLENLLAKNNSAETVDSVVFNLYFCSHISRLLFVDLINRKNR